MDANDIIPFMEEVLRCTVHDGDGCVELHFHYAEPVVSHIPYEAWQTMLSAFGHLLWAMKQVKDETTPTV